MTRVRLPGVAMLLALAGCGHAREEAVPERIAPPTHAERQAPPPGADWRRMATPQDRYRLRGWRTAWATAFDRAGKAGLGKEIAEQGALFDPDRALDMPVPPPGEYRCRVFKVGANAAAAGEFTSYPWFRCHVELEGDVFSLTKTGGSQRPVGLIFKDTPTRAIFLGTMMLGDEKRPIDYGRDAGRDMIGAVERVGQDRWRVILPYPRFESITDVMELVPAS